MKLSIKIMVIICAIFLAMVLLFHSITSQIILSSFERLEEQNTRTNIERVLNTLAQDLAGISLTGGDWGAWDETRDFLKDINDEYISNNLGVGTLENLNLNFMLYFNNNAEMVYSVAVELGEEAEETTVSTELINAVRGQRSLYIHKDAEDEKTGIILMPEEMALISAWPISNNETIGPVSGTLIIGRYLGDNDIKSIEERTQLDVAFYRTDDNDAPDDIIAAKKELIRGSGIAINRDLPDVVSGYSFLRDISGEDSLVIKASCSREIFKQGRATTKYFMLVFLTIGFIVFAVLFFTLQYAVIGPIHRLTDHVLSVAKSGDLSARMFLRTRDEIGALAGEFDRMLEQLSDARNRLMEQSYYSGVGEMASGVLHNIRNILTPMVDQIDKIKERISDTPVHNMEQASSELIAEDLEDERERSLKRYLQLACSRLGGLCFGINESIDVILEQAAHMEAVLSQHDKSGMLKKALEPLSLSGIVDEAVALMPEGLRNAVDIETETDLAKLPQVYAERITLIQVFTNLFNNASESILRKGLKKGNIWVSGISEKDGNIQKIHVIIRDNGEGIDTKDQKKIFNRGYSTKTPKSSGIGLHWSCNALSAMKADLYVESEGVSHGCSFHIKLPVFNN